MSYHFGIITGLGDFFIMKTRIIGNLMIFLACMLALAGIASAQIPVNLDKVWVEGVELAPGSLTTLNLERGQDINLDFKVTANGTAKDVQIKASLRGYEYNDHERTSDTTHVFDVKPNITYRKSLELEAPDRMDDDFYKLRITVMDRYNNEHSYSFNLKISAERHEIQIKDILFSPENGIRGGKYFQAKLRIKNNGAKDEESVKISASIPDLGISGSVYIDNIEAGDTESSEEIWLTIPECAEPDFYQVVVKATYDEGYETVTRNKLFTVTGNDCRASDDSADEEEEDAGNDADSQASAGQGQQTDGSGDKGTDNASGKSAARNFLEFSLIILAVVLALVGITAGFVKVLKEKAY